MKNISFLRFTQFCLLTAFIVLNASHSAFALAIIQPLDNGRTMIDIVEAVGQSFLAEDASVSIGFKIGDINTQFPNLGLTMNLFEGSGMGGTLLGTVFSTVPDSYDDFLDFDFSSVSLTPGNVYTASIEAPNYRWGVYSYYWGTQYSDPYVDGTAFFYGSARIDEDLTFRVLPTAPVPEPSSLFLLFTGVVGLLGYGWRRKRK